LVWLFRKDRIFGKVTSGKTIWTAPHGIALLEREEAIEGY
jgi:hypothetical protein